MTTGQTPEGNYLRAAMVRAAREILQKGVEETDERRYVDWAQKLVLDVSISSFQREYVPMQECVMDSLKTVENLYAKSNSLIGIPTGFPDLDQLTSGLQPSDLIIVAGKPSTGKSAFVANVAQHVSMLNQGPVAVGIFSLGMSIERLTIRMLSSVAGIDHSLLQTGSFIREDWPSLMRAAGWLADANILIDDSPELGIMELRTKARRMAKDYDIGLLIVDYLQLMGGVGTGRETREEEISQITRLLKSLAMEMRIPIIAVSQLDRKVKAKMKGDKLQQPQLSDLQEFDSIKQDADIILFIHRDYTYRYGDDNDDSAELIIGKNRNGGTGTVELRFIENVLTFRN